MGASDGTNLLVRTGRRLRLEMDRAGGKLQDVRRRRRNAGRVFRPVFVAGAIGSGTSLLAASLAQRLAVAGVTFESAREVSRSSCLWIDRVNRFASVRAYEQVLPPRPSWTVERARQDLLRLYRAKAAGDADVFVDKGPNTNLVRARFLADAFPDAHFVLIFRDPVANVEGFRRKWRTFADDSLEESVRFWAAIHERFLEQAESLPGVTAVEYEALVGRYDEVLGTLASRLGVGPAAEARPVAARSVGRGRGLRGVESGRIRVVRDANARSLATLDTADVARIRETLHPLHERLRARAAASGLAARDTGNGAADGAVEEGR